MRIFFLQKSTFQVAFLFFSSFFAVFAKFGPLHGCWLRRAGNKINDTNYTNDDASAEINDRTNKCEKDESLSLDAFSHQRSKRQ